MTVSTSQPPPEIDPEPAAIHGSTYHLVGAASCCTSDPIHAATGHRALAVRESRKSGDVTAVKQAHGEWLRQLRQARGWSIAQMVRELRAAATFAGDKLPDKETMIVMIHRWERGGSGISERYRLHYSTAFKTPVDRFGDPSILDSLHANGIGRFGRGHAGGVQPHSARDRMQAALSQMGDPAERDQMCFLLGYLCALMTTAAPAHAPAIPSCPPDLTSGQLG